MAENTEIVNREEGPKGPKNLFSLFPKFNFQFPFLKQEPAAGVAAVEDGARKEPTGGEESTETPKPDIVRFPKPQVVAPPPVSVECDESLAKTTNPAILWQVYAIGGYLVFRWLMAKWIERKGRKEGSSDDEQPSNDE